MPEGGFEACLLFLGGVLFKKFDDVSTIILHGLKRTVDVFQVDMKTYVSMSIPRG